MAAPRKSRAEWIDAAFGAMAKGGVDGVRVERLARSLGVTKGSFYWHFEDRNALLIAIVDAWEQRGTENIIKQVDALGADARARARHLRDLTMGGAGMAGAGMPGELAIRDWARRDPDIAARLQRVDDRRMQYLRELLVDLGIPAEEVESRAMLAYSLLIGNYFIAARHGRRSRRRVLEDAFELLMRRD